MIDPKSCACANNAHNTIPLFGHSSLCPNHPDLPKRALHPFQKRDLLERLFAIWMKYPELRLGQLIESAHRLDGGSVDLFMAEDADLIQAIEGLVVSYNPPK